jgi:arylformamidase
MIVHDITRPIEPGMFRWPGDPAPELVVRASTACGDDYTLHSLTCSTHCGTHVDAPAHFVRGGRGVVEVGLHPFVGEAEVVTVRGDGPADADTIARARQTDLSRLLLRRECDGADASGVWLTDDAADRILELGIVLVGTEGPSVDDPASVAFPVHRRLLGAEVAILELCDLRRVADGAYLLCCAPLKWLGAEGSPVRAVLLQDDRTSARRGGRPP